MEILLFKISAALLILITSLLAGLGPLRKIHAHPLHPLLELGESFAGGIFLGIALFHMLPDAQTSFRILYPASHYPYTELLCASGFVTLLFLEKVLLRVGVITTQLPNSITYVLPAVLSLHALIEGTALGINIDVTNVILIFVAIIIHKGSESLALAINLGRSNFSLNRSIVLFLLWAIMSPLGISVGTLIAHHLQSSNGLFTAAIFNAFAAGTFLYIATLHKASHLCSHDRKTDHLWEYLLFLTGLSLMAVVKIWL